VTVEAEIERIRVLRAMGREADYLDAAVALAGAHPDAVGAQIEAAYACDRFGREADAIGYYDAAWTLGVPDQARRTFLVGYGSTLRNVGRAGESVGVLRRAVAEYPEFAPLPAFLALSLHSAGRHAEALATALDAVIRLGHEAGALDGYDRALREYRDQLLADT
jgi:predicted Zn-dependent protease